METWPFLVSSGGTNAKAGESTSESARDLGGNLGFFTKKSKYWGLREKMRGDTVPLGGLHLGPVAIVLCVQKHSTLEYHDEISDSDTMGVTRQTDIWNEKTPYGPA